MIKKIYALIESVLIRLFSNITAIPIACGIILVSPLMRIRLIQLFSSRIGHYAINTEIILCALDTLLEKNKAYKTIFYIDSAQPICNSQLHAMWKRTIPIIPFALLAYKVDRLLLRFGGKEYKNYPIKKLQVYCEDKYNLLEKVKKCHLSFTDEEEKRGKVLLQKLGIPVDAKFICLLVRDASYLSAYMPKIDWSYHIYRDADINSYQLAANYLADNGYYVIRMGKVVKDQFLTNNPKIIDYANSSLRSDFMDIYLSAHCFFFSSTCCGLDSVARVFRKPLLITNLVLADIDIWHPCKIFIPKKILDVKKDRVLTYKEMNALFFEMHDKKQIPKLMHKRALRYIDNTPEEIRKVTHEMVEQLTGNAKHSEEDEQLQKCFWKDFPKHFKNVDCLQWDIPISENIQIRIGSNFLKNNLSLLTDIDILQVHAS